MLQQIIENKLNRLRINYKITGEDFILAQCINPSHRDATPSMSINVKTGYAKCFTCGFVLGKEYWIEGVYDVDEEEIERQALYNKLKSRKTSNSVETSPIILPPKSEEIPKNYRGLSNEILQKLDIYVCKVGRYKDRVILPIKYGDKVKAFETRALTDDITPKYLHSKGFSVKELIYPYNLIGKKSYVVLVEGIFDAIAMNDYGLCSICNFGVAFNFNRDKINKLIELGIDTIYISFDKDAAGAKAEVEFLKNEYLKEYFEVKTAKHLTELEDYYNNSYKDFNAYLLAKKGEN
jgi:DNA primase